MEVQRKMKSNTYKEYIAPVVVLVCICLVITAALAVTYGVTNPIIIKNSKAAADKTRTELLKDADSFTQYNGKLVVEEAKAIYVQDVYTANNGAGMVATVVTKSFGGALTMMVGIDNKGEITGVKVTNHADTPGLGTKNMTTAYLGQYKGLTKMNSTNVKEDGQIKYISGASVTGSAIHYGVYAALDQFKAMGGVK
jgi:electron transport complex protein RnfG